MVLNLGLMQQMGFDKSDQLKKINKINKYISQLVNKKQQHMLLRPIMLKGILAEPADRDAVKGN